MMQNNIGTQSLGHGSSYGNIVSRDVYIARERARSSINLYTAGLIWRIREERQLFWAQWRVIFFCIVSLVYFGLMVFRNIAFYRFVPGPRLHDLGFELIPELSPEQQKISDVPLTYFYILFGLVVFGVFIGHDCPGVEEGSFLKVFNCFSQRVVRYNRRTSVIRNDYVINNDLANTTDTVVLYASDKPYLANMIRRLSSVYLAGHVLRAMTYISTSLPGSADHCMPGEKLQKPESLIDCFTRAVSINGNCGDLNFSGHMLLMVMGICMIEQYGAKAWLLKHHGVGHFILMGMAVVLSIVQAYFILAARHHYSTDIVLGVIVTPMLWYFFRTEILPEDLRPNEELILQEIENEKKWSFAYQIFHAFLALLFVAMSLTGLIICMKGNFAFLYRGHDDEGPGDMYFATS